MCRNNSNLHCNPDKRRSSTGIPVESKWTNAGANSATYAYIPLMVICCNGRAYFQCSMCNGITCHISTCNYDSQCTSAGQCHSSSRCQPCMCRDYSYLHCNPDKRRSSTGIPVESKWTNAGANSATYPRTITGDVVTVDLTSNAICATGSPATSAPVTMTVNANLPVSVTIAAAANPVCAGTTVTFTATPTNGGAAPAYQWKVNGINVGANSATYSYIPLTGDVVTVELTSNAICATGHLPHQRRYDDSQSKPAGQCHDSSRC